MKAIIFDVDGVIVISAEEKTKRIKTILRNHNLYDIDWVKDIFALSLNRIVLVDMIHEITPFDKQKVLWDINASLEELEHNPVANPKVVDFIRNNHGKYSFFTNTSLPKKSLKTTFHILWITDYFVELFAGEDGMKLDNTYTILEKYGLRPEETLFIDDSFTHIEKVSQSWVHLLHFDNLDIDINQELHKYN